MFNLSLPAWEMMIRAVAVYSFLLVTLRLTGKRQIGQLAPFDLVLLLILSNAVQNSMNGGDNSLIGGLISALTLLIFNFGIAWFTYRNKTFARLVDGVPEVIIHNGKIIETRMNREQITHHELETALRQAGCSGVHDVQFAVLETNGAITVIKREPSLSKGSRT